MPALLIEVPVDVVAGEWAYTCLDRRLPLAWASLGIRLICMLLTVLLCVLEGGLPSAWVQHMHKDEQYCSAAKATVEDHCLSRF